MQRKRQDKNIIPSQIIGLFTISRMIRSLSSTTLKFNDKIRKFKRVYFGFEFSTFCALSRHLFPFLFFGQIRIGWPFFIEKKMGRKKLVFRCSETGKRTEKRYTHVFICLPALSTCAKRP